MSLWDKQNLYTNIWKRENINVIKNILTNTLETNKNMKTKYYSATFDRTNVHAIWLTVLEKTLMD
jgi:hypothetical protein